MEPGEPEADQRGGDGQRLGVNGGGQRLVSAALQHVWLADCNVRGAPADALAVSMPALQTLVVRNQCQAQDLPPRLLAALGDLKVSSGGRAVDGSWFAQHHKMIEHRCPGPLLRAPAPAALRTAVTACSLPCCMPPGPQPDLLFPAIHRNQDLTTLGLGGFSHTQLPALHGLTRLRHLMLDPRRFGDTEVDPDVSSNISKSNSVPPGLRSAQAQLRATPAYGATRCLRSTARGRVLPWLHSGPGCHRAPLFPHASRVTPPDRAGSHALTYGMRA